MTYAARKQNSKPQSTQPFPPLEGIALWESIIRKTDTAEIYNLMQQNGGYQHFVDLMTESRIAHETIDNGIKANEKRIVAWGLFAEGHSRP